MSFGFRFEDLAGNFVPYDRDTNSTTINPTDNNAIPITFDEFSIMMHFSKDAPGCTANLKYDYVIGELDDPTLMDGLSLSQNLMSVLINSDTVHVVNRIESEDSNEVESEENLSRRARYIRFRAGSANFAEIRMDDIPYTWNETEEVNATGQLVPIHLVWVMYGMASMEGQWINCIRGHATARVFLYSISYPKWSGLSISHDPTFTLISGTGGSSGDIKDESEKGDDGFAPGFDFLVVFLVLVSIPILRFSRRSHRE